MLELNLPEYSYKLGETDGRLTIFDPVRKKFVVLTPEEWVRQHFINLLNNHLDFPRSLTSVETGIKYNSRIKRTDIMVLDEQLRPLVLVECKAPSVSINQSTVRQLAVYNKICQAKLLVVTNGMVTYACLCKPASEQFEPLTKIPAFKDLKVINASNV